MVEPLRDPTLLNKVLCMDMLLIIRKGANSSTFELPRSATPGFETGVFKTGDFKMGKFKTVFAENLGQ